MALHACSLRSGGKARGGGCVRVGRPLGGDARDRRGPVPAGARPARLRQGPHRPQHRRADAGRNHDPRPEGTDSAGHAVRRVRHPSGGPSEVGRPVDPRSSADGAGHAGGAARREQVGDHLPGLRQPVLQQAPGPHGRPKRLHAAVLGGLLGCPGHPPRRHRADRGHPRAGRDDVGLERHERGDQHHHEARGVDAGGLPRGRSRHGAARFCGRAVRRDVGRGCPLPGLREVLQSGAVRVGKR